MTKILVVEDDSRLAEAICKYLQCEGYQCRVAQLQGSMISDALNNDMVICDIKLGTQFSGVDILKHLRKTSTVRVVVISAYPQYVQIAFDIGVDAFIKKPFDLETLGRVVQELCVAEHS